MGNNTGQKISRLVDFQKTSLIDWGGKLSTVVFLSGCNWRCPFCHNFRLWEPRSEIDEDEIFSYLEKNRNWIDGVVMGGGEPLFDKDIIPFTEKLKKLNFKIKVDTNGSYPEMLIRLIDGSLVDYVSMDIKTALSEGKYEKATGVKDAVNKVRKSMDVLFRGNIDFELRTTMVPEIVGEEDIVFNLQFIPSGVRYILQQFSPDNAMDPWIRTLSPYTKEELEKILKRIRERGMVTCFRG